MYSNDCSVSNNVFVVMIYWICRWYICSHLCRNVGFSLSNISLINSNTQLCTCTQTSHWLPEVHMHTMCTLSWSMTVSSHTSKMQTFKHPPYTKQQQTCGIRHRRIQSCTLYNMLPLTYEHVFLVSSHYWQTQTHTHTVTHCSKGVVPLQVMVLMSSVWTGTPPRAWWSLEAKTASSPSNSGTQRLARVWLHCEFLRMQHVNAYWGYNATVNALLAPLLPRVILG